MNRVEQMWAIDPRAMATVIQFLTGQTRALPQAAPLQRRDKVAVIPIHGVLTNDGPAYLGSNYQSIADAAEKAAADPDVKRIVLSVDSPGGAVTGLSETAAIIAAAAKIKPVSAIVEGAAASAAYWLTSQAHDITLTPSGEVGSVGVRMMHVDMSKKMDAEGFKVTELHSGKFKTEWSPYKPLSEDAQADMQVRLDATHRQFLSAISSGRGRRVSTVLSQNQFGGGRMFSAEDAKRHGLVDGLGSARAFYRGLSQSASEVPLTPGMARVALARTRLEILKDSLSLR